MEVFDSTGDRPADGGAGVVVCDGVGSYRDSGIVAERVATVARNHLAGTGLGSGMWELAEIANESLIDSVEGATTLIAVGADPGGSVYYAYVGNGAIVELQPRRVGPQLVQLRWVDVALPQISWEEGRPALRSFLPIEAGELDVSKGVRVATGGSPRLFLACSDGIATDEDRAQARSKQGRFWKSVPIPLARLVDEIGRSWDELLDVSQAEAGALLESVLGRTLAAMLEESELDDDASVGCVLLRLSGGAP